MVLDKSYKWHRLSSFLFYCSVTGYTYRADNIIEYPDKILINTCYGNFAINRAQLQDIRGDKEHFFPSNLLG